jgi:tetratricopeptide (TPR) repeat protein
VFLGLGKHDKAFEDVNIAIEKDKTNHYFYDTRGQIYMSMGLNKEALRDFDNALSLDANFMVTLKNRAKCYRKLAETEQDPAKEADLIAKAEADEKKAESLKNGDKT